MGFWGCVLVRCLVDFGGLVIWSFSCLRVFGLVDFVGFSVWWFLDV